jgi:hypothetical protein
MRYPVTLTFKIIALAPQISVRDAGGQEILYVKQKLLKLKEKIRVFSDAGQTRQLYEINADRVLDFSARYSFTAADGQPVGSVKRRGARSLWRSTYEVTAPDGGTLLLEEENPWIKLADAVIGAIPLVGAFTGYFLNPKYLVRETSVQRDVLRVVKHRSFLESRFEVESLGTLPEPTETAALLAVLTMTLLERERG